MKVKCLTAFEKDAIISLYQRKESTQKELAEMYDVSERTINRVFIEAGLATPVARLKGEGYHAVKLMEKYQITLTDLTDLLVAKYGY